MGLRHRSIRLRVGLLIAVPILCLLALYGFVASITVGNAVSQQHARTLRNDIANPVTAFQTQVAQERYFALLSLANPTDTAVAAKFGVQERGTEQALTTLTSALHSPAVNSYAAKPENAAIANLISASHSLTGIRGDVADDAISLHAALADYDAIIDAGYAVIVAALDQQTDVSFVTQGLGIVDLGRAAQATQAEWDLLSADIAQRKFPQGDRLVFAAMANQRQTLVSAAVPTLDAQYQAMLAQNIPATTANAMTSIEAAVIATPWRHGAPPAQLAGSKMTFLNYSTGLGNGLNEATDAVQAQAQHNANTQVLELILAAGLGLVGTIASIVLSLFIGRDLVGQLRELRQSALTLARERLPNVIGRLRAGESVDISDYTPADISSASEIDQVQHAFSLVQQTAVQSAVDEARLRRGISDVFRNLAGRSQSLLHRQLTLLDGMERRATEPDELEDLFRIDHLTTRMRRHAEGLIILSGEAPARGWRQPVPLVDVLRAAVAEVEDYTRIRVVCRTNAGVAGHAVADIIHLIAELAENATVFSPPNTPVRIQGDSVGRGFAVEIEDRGLGISAARLEEINSNLANPPQFDLSGSDRLGLFIAGQLAQRHDIKITLQPSVYGGTTAIVLIPIALAVDEDAVGREPALSADHDDLVLAEGLSGRHAALDQPAGRAAVALPSNGLTGSDSGSGGPLGASPLEASLLEARTAGTAVAGPAGSGGLRGNGHLALELAAERLAAERLAAADRASSELAGQGMASHGMPGAGLGGTDLRGTNLAGTDLAGTDLGGTNLAGTDLAGPGQGGDALVGRTLGPRGYARPEPDPDAADYIGPGFSLGGRATPSAGLPRRAGGEPREAAPGASEQGDSRVSSAEVTELGLPVRVRQASLAPQLRKSPPAPDTQTGFTGGFSIPGALAPGATGPDTTGPGATGQSGIGSTAAPTASPASGPTGTGPASSPIPPTPEAARDTMSALQRGWQLGRSEADTVTDASISVFTPRKSPSGQAFGPHEPDAEATDTEPGDSGDERGGE